MLSLASAFWPLDYFNKKTSVTAQAITGKAVDTSSGLIFNLDGSSDLNLKNGAKVTTTDGVGGKAVSFDGFDDYAEISNSNNPSAYTLSAWVKPDLLTTQNIIVRTDSRGPLSSWSHQLRINSRKLEHYLYDGNWRNVSGKTSLQPGQWYHVVGTAQNNGAMKLYVNGQEEGTSINVGTLWSGGNRYLVGSNSNGFVYFNGLIDEVRIYNRVLTADDVKALYDAQKAQLASGSGGSGNTILYNYTKGDRVLTVTKGLEQYAIYFGSFFFEAGGINASRIHLYSNSSSGWKWIYNLDLRKGSSVTLGNMTLNILYISNSSENTVLVSAPSDVAVRIFNELTPPVCTDSDGVSWGGDNVKGLTKGIFYNDGIGGIYTENYDYCSATEYFQKRRNRRN